MDPGQACNTVRDAGDDFGQPLGWHVAPIRQGGQWIDAIKPSTVPEFIADA